MSFSFLYLTRRPAFLNYRDYIAMGLITYYGAVKFVKFIEKENNELIMTRVYTNDESDIRYKETTNKVDSAVRREKAMAYSEHIKALRA